ncbi:hypothetical protein AA0488_0272 [Kozakia baliensis NRIC 0488]|nr:hypothetical protein AA0488_0272 [Kozakia baliensis NRIC 0488]
MAPLRIIKSVDVLEDDGGCLPPRWPDLSPEQFSLQSFEEGFDGGIIEAVFLAGHGWHHPAFRQFLLEIV